MPLAAKKRTRDQAVLPEQTSKKVKASSNNDDNDEKNESITVLYQMLKRRTALLDRRKMELTVFFGNNDWQIEHLSAETVQRLRELMDCIREDEKIIEAIIALQKPQATTNDADMVMIELAHRLTQHSLLEHWRKLVTVRDALRITGGELRPELANLQQDQDTLAEEIRRVTHCLESKEPWRVQDQKTLCEVNIIILDT